MSARAGLHAMAGTVLIPFGLALTVLGLVRSVVLGVTGMADIRSLVSLSVITAVGLVVLGIGLGWLGMRAVRRFFTIVDDAQR